MPDFISPVCPHGCPDGVGCLICDTDGRVEACGGLTRAEKQALESRFPAQMTQEAIQSMLQNSGKPGWPPSYVQPIMALCACLWLAWRFLDPKQWRVLELTMGLAMDQGHEELLAARAEMSTTTHMSNAVALAADTALLFTTLQPVQPWEDRLRKAGDLAARSLSSLMPVLTGQERIAVYWLIQSQMPRRENQEGLQ